MSSFKTTKTTGSTEPAILYSDTESTDPVIGASDPVITEYSPEIKLNSSLPEVEAARSRAKQYMADGQFAEARKALEEAENLSAGPVVGTAETKGRMHRFASSVGSKFRTDPIVEAAEQSQASAHTLASTSVEQALKTVRLYSKIAAGAGLLPTFVLNFAAVLAVQVTMVWKIARAFKQPHGKDKIKGSIMSLVSSVLPGTVGHGIGLAVAAIPAVVTGTILSFVLAPALAYALTKAVGNVFIMHFESGGTLLNFDPREFREYFLRELNAAGATSKIA